MARGRGGSAGARRLLVLPLENISPDPADEYFADGMTEEFIAALSKLPQLRVIARTTSMRFKGLRPSVAELRRELDVQSLLEGTVRKSGNRIRIAVRLVDTGSEEPLWGETYDRELADVFVIQREIANRVARSLRIRTREGAVAVPASTGALPPVDAYTLYLQGRFQYNLRSEAGLHRALTLFEGALAKDPKFSLALVGLADSYASLALLEVVAPTEAFPRARAAAEKALALDPGLAEAHTSLGLARFQYERDWEGAEVELRRGIELNPNYPPAHQFYADYLKAMGRFDEALEEMGRALELDPLSLTINTGLGHVLYLARRFDDSIQQYRKSLEMDPKFATAHLWFGRPYLQKGMFDEAIAEVRHAVELTGGSTISLAVLGHAYASAGRTAEAEEILGRLLKRAQETYLPSYWIGLLYTGLGRSETALEWLEKAYEQRSSWLVWIKVEPRFDPLRALPRFQLLMRRMRLDDPQRPSPELGDAPGQLRGWLIGLSEFGLSRYRVVGRYSRFEEGARNALKDLRTTIARTLTSGPARVDSFLLWAAPGSGKTYFVREMAGALAPEVDYAELNLAELDERAMRARLPELGRIPRPTLVLIDEVDSQPSATWPYEILLPALEPPRSPPHPLVFVLAGSGGSTVDEFAQRISGRPKGSDLLSRVPAAHRATVPSPTARDRIVVSVSALRSEAAGARVTEMEKIALYYLSSAPELASPRQLRQVIARALERKPRDEERLKFDHLFDAGDPQNKRFWNDVHRTAPGLIDSYVAIRD